MAGAARTETGQGYNSFRRPESIHETLLRRGACAVVFMAGGSHYHSASFVASAPDLRAMPPDQGWEVAFAGRSNVGKSSVLNALTGRRGLARTSKTPGRTQMLNVFGLDPQRRLIDLPGYGFAQVPEPVRQRWRRSVEAYLRRRRSLAGLVLISDVRRPLGTLDQAMLEWLGHHQLPVHVLLNKADKLGRGAAVEARRKADAWLHEHWPNASCQLFSAAQPAGLDELRERLDLWLGLGSATADDQPTAGSGGALLREADAH